MLFPNQEKINTIIFHFDEYVVRNNPSEIHALRSFCQEYDLWFFCDEENEIKGLLLGCRYHILPWPSISFPNMSLLKYVMIYKQVSLESIAFFTCNKYTLRNSRNTTLFTAAILQLDNYDDYGGLCPDIFCSSLSEFKELLEKEVYAYYGEVVLAEVTTDFRNDHGKLLKMRICRKSVPDFYVISAGRYYGYNHFLHSVHPYSNAIIINKKAGSKLTHQFDELFSNIFIKEIIAYGIHFDGLCAVPDKPGKEKKFSAITECISRTLLIEDISNKFICIKDFKDQKSLISSFDRQENVKNAFHFCGILKGKTVALIDDIVTSAATLTECVKTLYKAGAENVVCFVLAYNQFDCSYFGDSDLFLRVSGCFRFNYRNLKAFYKEKGNYNNVLKDICYSLNQEILEYSYSDDQLNEEF